MCRVDPADLGHQGTVDRLPMALGAAAPSVIPRRRDAQHIAHGANLEGIALIFDKTKFQLGVSEKMRSVFFRISRSICRRSFSRRRRAFSAAKSAPACGIAACVLERRGAPACPPSPLFRQARSLEGAIPSSARQQPHRLPPEFIRVLATRCTHQTPSCSFRSLSEVSTISREGHCSLLWLPT